MASVRKGIERNHGRVMMEHQEFEELIWAENQLPPDQENKLREHLASCQECRSIHTTWQTVDFQMMNAEVIPAPPGFLSRWNSELAERKSLAKVIQVRRMALFTSLSALVSLAAVLGFTLYVSTPVDMIVAIVKSASGLISLVNQVGSLLSNIAQIIPPIIPAVYWLAFTSLFSFLAFLWIISIWQISKQGVHLK
jgi:hypothetical protein